MSNRSKAERNREKVVQDRLQLLLTRMLQDEDNKYCVDCDAKGPRWASWNIGIFLCIRCAGIHRNLGVHISKVKSVNLDDWTPQQVASMQIMGNSKGRAVYEAGVPEDFRRPQSDSALETFIRSKYEKKKYIAREWTPTKPPDLPLGWEAIIEAEKQKKDLRSVVLPSRVKNDAAHSNPAPKTSPVIKKTSVPAKKESAEAPSTGDGADSSNASSAAEDLLGLSLQAPAVNGAAVVAPTVNAMTSNLDLLSLGNAGTDVHSDGFDHFVGAPAATPATAASVPPARSGVDFDGAFSPSNAAASSSQMSKDSIMALFNQPPAGGGAPPSAGLAVGGSGANTLAGLNFGASGQAGFPPRPGFNQFQPAQPQAPPPFGMTQINPLGGMQAMAAQPQNNPFLSNTVDAGFGAMKGLPAANGNAKNSSWGFGQ